MPGYKVLKGVAHNVGHSFTSLMNYADDDYTMGYILRFARDAGNVCQVSIEALAGRLNLSGLLIYEAKSRQQSYKSYVPILRVDKGG